MNTFNKFLLSLILASFFIEVNAQTIVPQVISSDQTWTALGSPYIVNQNVLIKTGFKVKIMPGTKVRTTGDFKIIVEGGVEAKGTKDSIIRLDSVSFDFLKGSVGYDFSTNTGSMFSYCFFNGSRLLGISKSINLNQTSMLISNCRFFESYYCVYDNYSPKVRIEKSIFDGGKSKYGYAYNTYSSNTIGELEMEECVVKNMYGIYLANTSTITKNLFYNLSSGIRIGAGLKSATIKCNVFRKNSGGLGMIEILPAQPSKIDLIIVSNTFDSSDYHIYYMVTGTPFSKFVCKNNNFIHFNKYSVFVSGGSKPGYADTLVFTKNYWNSADPAKIVKKIWDITDDIAVAGLVDYANYNSSMNSDCIEEESEEKYIGGSGTNVVKEVKNITFTIFPNPAKDMISIQSLNNTLKFWKIYNTTGELIITGDIYESTNSIVVDNLQAGVYFVQVLDDNNFSSIQKLTINR